MRTLLFETKVMRVWIRITPIQFLLTSQST